MNLVEAVKELAQGIGKMIIKDSWGNDKYLVLTYSNLKKDKTLEMVILDNQGNHLTNAELRKLTATDLVSDDWKVIDIMDRIIDEDRMSFTEAIRNLRFNDIDYITCDVLKENSIEKISITNKSEDFPTLVAHSVDCNGREHVDRYDPNIDEILSTYWTTIKIKK